MPIRLGRFEMPKTLVKNEKTATETYAQFVAEPFEAGYGHTIGNSLRRTLLSSLEGAAITSVKIFSKNSKVSSRGNKTSSATPHFVFTCNILSPFEPNCG